MINLRNYTFTCKYEVQKYDNQNLTNYQDLSGIGSNSNDSYSGL